ncbi:MAG: MotA/TolQ/ExbB proton channel family protein [Planctomycetota bacterium]
MEAVWQSVVGLMTRGGVAMWPLLALSLLAVTVSVERVWFFVSQNRRGELNRVQKLADRLRRGDRAGAEALVDGDGSVYGRAAAVMLSNGLPCGEAATAEAVESQRGRLERYLPLLSTIITAAPMLGILGTVIGIITSFEALGAPGSAGEDGSLADPRAVSSGIAEALLSTAAGLTVSLIALFPYNAFRAQVDRTMSRLEMLGVSAELAETPKAGQSSEADGASSGATPAPAAGKA